MSLAPKKVLVLGAGISGLTCAFELVNRGHQVTVIYAKDASQTPSVIAGALWEWPPAVCGHHTDVRSLERSKPWCFETYQRFQQLSENPESGIVMERAHFYFFHPVESNEFENSKLKEIRQHCDGVVHDPALIEKNGVNKSLQLKDSYSFIAPVINTPIYTRWLRRQVESMGVKFQQRAVGGGLDAFGPLLDEFDASLLINCSGLGARNFGDEQVYPLRGALVQLKLSQQLPAPGVHCISHDDAKTHQNMIYLVPRGDTLLLGGIAQPNEWNEELSVNDSIVKGIVDRCLEFMPDLARLRSDEQLPVLVGLRPARNGNVRLEWEPEQSVIHNYGHGGSGFSMSWGCAKEVASLV